MERRPFDVVTRVKYNQDTSVQMQDQGIVATVCEADDCRRWRLNDYDDDDDDDDDEKALVGRSG
jgi:hypothetical protein